MYVYKYLFIYTVSSGSDNFIAIILQSYSFLCCKYVLTGEIMKFKTVKHIA